jgi:hypothetical protein
MRMLVYVFAEYPITLKGKVIPVEAINVKDAVMKVKEWHGIILKESKCGGLFNGYEDQDGNFYNLRKLKR